MDMLVKLYEVDPHKTFVRVSKIEKENDIIIRQAMAYEKEAVIEFVRSTFTEMWAGWPSECEKAFSNWPLSCFIATCSVPGDITIDRKVVGFACYNATCRGFFGPSGVAEPYKRKGIGACLLLSALCAMRQEGYGYAIVGGPDKQEQWDFYSNTVGAITIDGSENGIYRDMLKRINH
ncbi:MAG: GNAT family N-acetyltransferase [Desulfobacteraceae bacterium]|nr:GNAT family N-acetyltransferase [Desulfobacteraceae bacterium]